MGKTVNIGGRIHNPEVGNVVAGANEILDDTKGKKQNVINSEVDTALAGLDSGKQDKLNFDQTPTESSTNPVTSGGVYAADQVLQQAIEAILLLIPSAASALNQLADKSFVNSSIATASATFRGTYNLVSDLHLSVSASHQDIATALASVVATADNNDYCFVQVPTSDTSSDIRVTERYKFNGTDWQYEYDLNNSGFTAQQWAAINSTITSALVGKLTALPTADELAALLAGKQATLTFDSTPTPGSANPVTSGGLYDKFEAIIAKIPSDASANNKLVAENRLAAYVGAIVGALDATFDLTSTDGHVTLRITQTDGLISSVQVLTSDIASAQALTTLSGQVSTNASDIATLQDLYNALQQSAPEIIQPTDTWPVANPSDTVIYRVIDRVNTPPEYYSDYMWNGTTMVLMATYNNAIDPRPKKGSANLVTSGGVFDNIGALDISELNASGGTLASYATLDAAIAAIPSDYQKGGMSIKFVSSVDNKYVQYRLMSDSFNATEANWINLNPTQDLNNESNSIPSNAAIYKNFYYIYEQHNGFINTSVSPKSWDNLNTDERKYVIIPISVSGSEKMTIRASDEGNSIYAFLSEYNPVEDGDASVLASSSVTTGNLKENIAVPAGSKFLYLLAKSGSTNRLPQIVKLGDIDILALAKDNLIAIHKKLYDTIGLVNSNKSEVDASILGLGNQIDGLSDRVDDIEGVTNNFVGTEFDISEEIPSGVAPEANNWYINDASKYGIKKGETLHIHTDPNNGAFTAYYLYTNDVNRGIFGLGDAEYYVTEDVNKIRIRISGPQHVVDSSGLTIGGDAIFNFTKKSVIAEIQEKITELQSVERYYTSPVMGYINSSTYKWQDLTGGYRYYSIIPNIEEFVGKKISVKGNSGDSSLVAFLSAFNPIEGEDAGVIELKTINAGVTKNYTIPQGTKYIYFLSGSEQLVNRVPQFIKIGNIDFISVPKDNILNVDKGINERIDDIINIEADIVKRNKEIEDAVYAAAYNLVPGTNSNYTKSFSMLIAGDIHDDSARMQSIVQYLNAMQSIDCGIMLGDIAGGNFTNSIDFYTEALQSVQRPFLTVIGNHDAGSTNSPSTSYTTQASLIAKFITPNIGFANLASGEYTEGANCYYYKDFSTYKIRIIVLNQFDYPDADAVGKETFDYRRGFAFYSQAQINWFINTLKNTPDEYHVIICLHYVPDDVEIDKNAFSSEKFGSRLYLYNSTDGIFIEPNQDTGGSIISDIVNAWINKTTLNHTYTYGIITTQEDLVVNAVDADFSLRTASNFVCYLGGHWHNSVMSHVAVYNDQKCYNVDWAKIGSEYTNFSDTPRKVGTRSEDCFCILTVDTNRKRVNLLRIGAHWTEALIDRLATNFNY